MRKLNWLTLGALCGAIVATALTTASLWMVDNLPIQDGPAHVWMTSAWGSFDESSRVMDFAVENVTAAPNWSATLILRFLLEWLSPGTAHTTLVTVLFLGFVLSMVYAITAVQRSGVLLSVLAVPLGMHWYLYRGSFNFAIGVVLLNLTLGYWLRRGESPTSRDGIVLSVLFLVTYFSHPVPFLGAAIAIGALGISSTRSHRSSEAVFSRRAITVPVVALVPSLALIIYFLLTSSAGSSGLGLTLRNPLAWVLSKISLRPILESLDLSERPWILLVAAAVVTLIATAVVLVFRSGRWRWTDGLLIGGVVLVLAAYVAPSNGLGGTSVPDRIFLCALVALVTWAGTAELPRWTYLTVTAATLVASLGLTLDRIDSHRLFDAQISEIVGVEELVEPGASILPVVLWEYLEPPFHRVMPPLYAGSWVAVYRDSVDLGNLDLGTDYHPLRWRDDLDQDLYDWMARFGPGDLVPSRTNGPSPSPGSIDYVLLIGASEGGMDPALTDWLDDGYDLVTTSQTRIAELYRARSGS